MLSQILKPQVIFAICKLLDVQTLQILHINNSMIIIIVSIVIDNTNVNGTRI